MKLKYVGLAVASLLLSGQAMSLWAWDCVLGQVRPQCPANQNQLQLRGRRSSLPQASPREPTQPHSCLSLPFWFRLLPLTLSLTLLSPHPPSPLSLDPLSIHLLLCCCCPQPHRHQGNQDFRHLPGGITHGKLPQTQTRKQQKYEGTYSSQ